MTDNPPKLFGRPTKYDPAYCEQVMQYGALGKSKAWIAATIGVTRGPLDNWMDANPDFLHAMTRAKDLEQLWWEDRGQEALGTRDFQASVWSRSMGARFPADWREKVAHTGGDKTDAPIAVSVEANAFAGRISSAATRAAASRGDGEPE